MATTVPGPWASPRCIIFRDILRSDANYCIELTGNERISQVKEYFKERFNLDVQVMSFLGTYINDDALISQIQGKDPTLIAPRYLQDLDEVGLYNKPAAPGGATRV
jgi:hypothetical protein